MNLKRWNKKAFSDKLFKKAKTDANRASLWTWGVFRFILVWGISFIILFPILYMIAMSMKSLSDLYNKTSIWLPAHLNLSAVIKNFKDAAYLINYAENMGNTLIYMLLLTVLQIISCCLIGYGFARFKFPGQKLLFGGVILTLIVPPTVILLPTYISYLHFDFFGLLSIFSVKKINLINTYWPFILTSITGVGFRNGLFIYVARQSFKSLPSELEESAYIDGCGLFKTFARIVLPNSLSMIMVILIFTMVWSYNDTLFYNTYLPDKMNIIIAVTALPNKFNQEMAQAATSALKNRSLADMGIVMQAASLLVFAPLLIFFYLVQRTLVQGVERSGLVE